MDRRNFLGAVAAGGASIAMASASETAKEDASVDLKVKKFSCITCAIGLETLLQQNAAIVRAKAEFRTGKVHVAYNSNKITVGEIRHIITEAGLSLVA